MRKQHKKFLDYLQAVLDRAFQITESQVQSYEIK